MLIGDPNEFSPMGFDCQISIQYGVHQETDEGFVAIKAQSTETI